MGTLNGGFGATRFPASAVVSASELDPGNDTIVGLLEAAIKAELGTAWRRIVSRLPSDHYLLKTLDGTPIEPVRYATTVEISPQQLTQFRAEFPVLSVYRQGQPEFSWATTGLRQLKQVWSVDYIVGPLKAAHIPRIGRFCVAAARVIDAAITHGYHPDFREGKRQFYGEFAQIDCVHVEGPGIVPVLDGESGSGYYGMTVALRSVERMFQDGYAGADAWDVNTGYVTAGTGTDPVMTEIWNDIDFDNETE